MRLMTVWCGVLLAGVILSAGGCEQPPTYIVYIDQVGCKAKTWDGDYIDPLWLFPGDRVIWVNRSSEDKTVSFEDETIFGEKEWTIAPGKRVTMFVKEGSEGVHDYNIIPSDTGECPPGSPQAKVGEDP